LLIGTTTSHQHLKPFEVSAPGGATTYPIHICSKNQTSRERERERERTLFLTTSPFNSSMVTAHRIPRRKNLSRLLLCYEVLFEFISDFWLIGNLGPVFWLFFVL
jgi:hypothetical protein